MNKYRSAILLTISIILIANANVKPHFQLTGNKRNPIDINQVGLLMQFPEDKARYDIIGQMGDCSDFSEYSEFISVFKEIAASFGANCIVVTKSPGNNSKFEGPVCVDATAIYLRPNQTVRDKDNADCVNELRQIIKLHKTIDSLRLELDKCKNAKKD